MHAVDNLESDMTAPIPSLPRRRGTRAHAAPRASRLLPRSLRSLAHVVCGEIWAIERRGGMRTDSSTCSSTLRRQRRAARRSFTNAQRAVETEEIAMS